MAAQIKIPGTIVDDSSVGTVAWSDPTNVQVLDGNFAVQNFSPPDTDTLQNFSKLVVADAITGDSVALVFNLGIGYNTAGSFNEMWGLALTPAIVNASDFGYAVSLRSTPRIGHALKCTNFGFSVPDDAIITGVTVTAYNQVIAFGGKIDYLYMTVYFQPMIRNVSTMTNISTITF